MVDREPFDFRSDVFNDHLDMQRSLIGVIVQLQVGESLFLRHWKTLENLSHLLGILPRNFFLGPRAEHNARCVVQLVIDFGAARDKFPKLVESQHGVILLHNQSHILQFADCSDHAKVEEFEVRVVHEVGTV